MSGTSQARTLHQIFDTGKALPPEQALSIGADLARILENQHRQSKMFGGIYPDQVQLESDGSAAIFELAAPRHPDDLTLSYLCFMPPEVLEGQPPVPESDLYSLGVMLYVLLTGKMPFEADSQTELTQQILNSNIQPLPPLIGSGAQADWIIKKCLIRNPKRRFASAQELHSELRKIAKPARMSHAAAAAASRKQPGMRAIKKQSREFTAIVKENWKIAAGIGAALVIGILAWLLWPSSRAAAVRAKGSFETRNLAVTTEVERDPSLSPDGDSIAYVSNFTGNWELYVKPVTGGKAVQLTQSPGREENPKWSPNGDMILFTYHGPGIPPTLFSVPPAGGIPQSIAADAIDGQWSPSGELIVYVTPAAEGERNLVVRDWRNLTAITVLKGEKGLAHPSFSSDGKEIVAEADIGQFHGLIIVDAESGEKKILTSDSYDYMPSWSWATDEILFTSGRDGTFSIWRITEDGKPQKVTNGKDNDFKPSPSMKDASFVFFREGRSTDIYTIDPEAPIGRKESPEPGNCYFPRNVSRDTLAFFRDQGDKVHLHWVMKGTTSASSIMRDLPPTSAFSVSQDGAYIFLQQPVESGRGLSQIPLKGGNIVDLGASLLLPYEVTPDKKFLFYAVHEGENAIYRLRNLKTQEEEDLFTRPFNSRLIRAAWIDNNRLAYLSAENVLSIWNIKENQTLMLFNQCFDFAFRPRSETIAALTGEDVEHADLITFDIKHKKRKSLVRFDPEAYARTIDWSRDGVLIYYDRFKQEADLYLAD